MASESEIRSKFWKNLKSDRTIMIGLIDDRTGHSQPMTAQRRPPSLTRALGASAAARAGGRPRGAGTGLGAGSGLYTGAVVVGSA